MIQTRKYRFGLRKTTFELSFRSKLKDKNCNVTPQTMLKIGNESGMHNFENLPCNFYGFSMNGNLQDVNFVKKATLK